MADISEKTIDATSSIEQADIEKVKNLQELYLKTTATVGQVTVEISVLTQRLAELEQYKKDLLDQYTGLQKQEQELVDELNTKYGEGVLDLSTGVLHKE